MTVNKVQS